MDSLRFRSKKICECADDNIKKSGMVGKNIVEKHGQKAMRETGLPVLKKGLEDTKKEADEMITDVERTETTLSEIISKQVSAQVASLEETFRERFEKMQDQRNDKENNFLKMQGDLHAGQTAYDFENYLCTHIYPPGTFATHDQKFTTLMNWLEENRDTPEGREGNRKWKGLTEKYGWTDETHIPIFFKMIRCRLLHAHPIVDFSLPIPENFNTPQEKKYVEDIRRMTAELHTLVVQ